jgi:hypothetical protein
VLSRCYVEEYVHTSTVSAIVYAHYSFILILVNISGPAAIDIADAIKNMGALSVLNLAENNLGALVLPEGWTEDYDSDDDEVYRHTDGREQSDNPGKPEGIIAIANAIPDMGALSVLDLAENGLGRGPSTWEYSSSPEHVGEFWNLNEGKYYKSLPPGECVGPAGLGAIASAISDSRAISSVNLLKNTIPVEQAQELVKIMQSKEKLITLCGLSGNEVALDFSKQRLGPGDAVLIANDISDMGALSILDASANSMFGESDKTGITAWADVLKASTSITELNLAKNYMDAADATILAPAISDNGALTKLNISNNNMEQSWALQQITECCSTKGIELDSHDSDGGDGRDY